MTYIESKNTYFAMPKDNPQDRIEVEIGDSKQVDFYPQVKIMRWDNEVNFSVRLIQDEVAPEISQDAEKIKWKGDKIEANFYELTENEGGYEFEVILNEKPLTNKIEFTLQTKGLDFFYQPALTAEEITQGASRPENVVGSYAVYTSEQKTNWEGGKLYRTGKFGHIYRPKVIDSAGNWTWGILNIDKIAGILSVEIPQKFLDEAVYPIRHAAGLTFGYDPAGHGASSTLGNPGHAAAGQFTGIAGTGVSMSAYMSAYSSSYLGKYFLKVYVYNAVDDKIGAPLENGTTTEGTTSATASYHTQNFISAPTFTAIEYILTVNWANYTNIYYDSTGGNSVIGAIGGYGANMQGLILAGSNKVSIYATYTAGGTAYTYTGLAKLGVKAIADRKETLSRSALVKDGIKVIATRPVAVKRKGLITLGVKVLAPSIVAVHNYIYTAICKLGSTIFGNRKTTVSRTGLLKDGATVIATRNTTVGRTGLIKDGEKVIATRNTTTTRSGLAKVGEKVIASPIMGFIRSGLLKLGSTVLGNRKTATIRIGLIKDGEKLSADRHTTVSRVGITKDGITALGTRYGTTIRTALNLLGLKVIGDRRMSTRRTGLIKDGEKVLGNRNVTASRTGLVSDGIKVLGTRKTTTKRSGLAALGEKVIGSRVVTGTRSGLAKAGITILADRRVAATRRGLALLGIKVIASYVYTAGAVGHFTYTALCAIGLKAISDRIVTAARSAVIKNGVTVLGDRHIALIRIGLIAEGQKVIADRRLSRARIGAIALGLKAIGNRQVAGTRTGIVKLGTMIYASRVITAIRSGLVQIGLKVFGIHYIPTYVHLTLQPRSLSLTLAVRNTSLTLQGRSFSLTLPERT